MTGFRLTTHTVWVLALPKETKRRTLLQVRTEALLQAYPYRFHSLHHVLWGCSLGLLTGTLKEERKATGMQNGLHESIAGP